MTLFDNDGKLFFKEVMNLVPNRQGEKMWMVDLVALKRSIIINGFTGICLTKLMF